MNKILGAISASVLAACGVLLVGLQVHVRAKPNDNAQH